MANNQSTNTPLPQDELLRIETNIQRLREQLAGFSANPIPGMSQEETITKKRQLGLQIQNLEGQRARIQIEIAAEKEADVREKKSEERGLDDKKREERVKKEREREHAKKERLEQQRHSNQHPNEEKKQEEKPLTTATITSESPNQGINSSISVAPEVATTPIQANPTLTLPHDKPGGQSPQIIAPRPPASKKPQDVKRIVSVDSTGAIHAQTTPSIQTPILASVQEPTINQRETSSLKTPPEEEGNKTLLYTSSGQGVAGKIIPKNETRAFARNEVREVEKGPKKTGSAVPAPSALSKNSSFWNIVKTPAKIATIIKANTPVPVKKALSIFTPPIKAPSAPSGNPITKPPPQISLPQKHGVKKNREPAPIRAIKSWLFYQTKLNNSYIKAAISRGHNRFLLIKNSIFPRTTPQNPDLKRTIPIPTLLPHAERVGETKERWTIPNKNLWPKETSHSQAQAGSANTWSGYGKTNNPSVGGSGATFLGYRAPGFRGINNALGRKSRGENRGALGALPSSGGQNGGSRRKPLGAAGDVAISFFTTLGGQTTLASIIVGAIIVIAIVAIVIAAGQGGGDNNNGSTIPPTGGGPGNPGGLTKNANPILGFTLRKTASALTLPAPAEITYTLSYTYAQPAGSAVSQDDITIFDNIPDNTTLVADKTTGTFTLDSSGKQLSWSLSDPVNKTLSSFSFTVIPTITDVVISNSAYATANGTAGNQASNSNDCNGYYASYLAAHGTQYGNYGDPVCNFATDNAAAKNDAINLLKYLDPDNAAYWAGVVIPRESAWIPIAYLKESTSGSGAFGLFQMNPAGKSTSGPNDVGNVDWRQQIPNAVKTRQLVGWGYWGGGPNGL